MEKDRLKIRMHNEINSKEGVIFFIRNGFFDLSGLLDLSFCCSILRSGVIYTFSVDKKSNVGIVIAQHLRFLGYSIFDLSSRSFEYVPTYAGDASKHGSVKKNISDLLAFLEIDEALHIVPRVLCSYDRPYHFFYELLPAIVHFYDSEYSSFFKYCGIGDGVFGDPEFLGLSGFEVFSDERSINSAIKNEKAFLLYPPKELLINEESITFYRDNVFLSLRGYCLSRSVSMRFKDKFPSSMEKIQSADCIVWFGFCNEKRKWLEQWEGLALLICMLKEKFSSPVIVVDGMTSTFSSFYDSSFLEVGHDDFSKIIFLYGSDIFVSANGMSSTEKIYLASRADFFITPFLTDSLFVSAISKRRGIAHGSNCAKFSQHHQPHAKFVPLNSVFDLNEEAEVRNWAYISYSLCPNMVVGEAEKLLCNDARKSRLFSCKSDSVRKCLIERDDDFWAIHNDEEDRVVLEVLDEETKRKFACRVTPGEAIEVRFEGVSTRYSALVIVFFSASGRVGQEKINIGGSYKGLVPLNAVKMVFFVNVSGGSVARIYNIHWRFSHGSDSLF